MPEFYLLTPVPPTSVSGPAKQTPCEKDHKTYCLCHFVKKVSGEGSNNSWVWVCFRSKSLISEQKVVTGLLLFPTVSPQIHTISAYLLHMSAFRPFTSLSLKLLKEKEKGTKKGSHGKAAIPRVIFAVRFLTHGLFLQNTLTCGFSCRCIALLFNRLRLFSACPTGPRVFLPTPFFLLQF